MMYVILCSKDKLCQEIADIYLHKNKGELIHVDHDHYPGNEVHITLPKTLKPHIKCIVIINLFKAHDDLMRLLLLLNTLTDMECTNIKLIVPYLSYLKQYLSSNQIYSNGQSILNRILTLYNIRTITTLDSYKINLPFKIINLPITNLFAKYILQHDKQQHRILIPDNNMIYKVETLSHITGLPYITLQKDHNRNILITKAVACKLTAYHNTQAIIIDDVAVTGKTLFQTTNILKEHNITKIDCYITHCLTDIIYIKYLENITNIFTYNIPYNNISKVHYISPITLF